MEYQNGMTALLLASYRGHTNTAVALAEKGADLNIQDTVSDCYLLVHDSEENAGNFETANTSVSVYVYVYMCMYIPARACILFVCMCICLYV